MQPAEKGWTRLFSVSYWLPRKKDNKLNEHLKHNPKVSDAPASVPTVHGVTCPDPDESVHNLLGPQVPSHSGLVAMSSRIKGNANATTRHSKIHAPHDVPKVFKTHNPFIPSPIVEPKFVKVSLPNTGDDDQSFQIKLKNIGEHRLAFKMRGTKLDCFQVFPIFGYLDEHSETTVEVQPREINDKDDDGEFNKFDHITVVMAPVPFSLPEDMSAKKLWGLHPKPTKVFQVRIEWTRPHDNADGLDIVTDPELNSESLHGHCTTDPRVEPEYLKVLVPSDGSEVDEIKIHNNRDDQRLAYKLRCTQGNRFRVDPPCGFVEPKQTATVSFQPRHFDEHDELGFPAHDHMTVLLTPAPRDAHDAKTVWNLKPAKPVTIMIPILYAMITSHKSKFHHMKVAKGEHGFYLHEA